jgi:hypothetical protein
MHRAGNLTNGPGGLRSSVWWQPFIDELWELDYVEARTLVIAYAGPDSKPGHGPRCGRFA